MKRRSCGGGMSRAVFGLLLGVLLAAPIWPQEGHPLRGSWHGEWRPSAGERTPLFLYMDWDAKAREVVGTINPGRNSVELKKVELDAENWKVHFEAEGKDASGAAVAIVADGALEDLGSYHRKIKGTWAQGSQKGEFELTRD